MVRSNKQCRAASNPVLQALLSALLVAMALSTSTFAGSNVAHADDELQSLTKSARAAAKSLVSDLKKELKTALKDGGPVHAIGVCKITAPAIAATTSEDSGLQVNRTALRVRNPGNAPDTFERQVMENFLAEAKGGTELGTLEHAEIIKTDDGNRTFRYMKPIPMAAKPCLACHGSNLKPDVTKAVKDAYPEDQATGFKPGELRGAFTISKPL